MRCGGACVSAADEVAHRHARVHERHGRGRERRRELGPVRLVHLSRTEHGALLATKPREAPQNSRFEDGRKRGTL